MATVIRRLERRAEAREGAIPMAPRPSIFETHSSGKTQPREAPLIVEVVQLQQSHPAAFAV
jgi:hypothetical protein